MALYNFQQRFVPLIKDGSKTHTIRAFRKYPQKVGDLMHLYWGLRSKWAQRIIDPQPCVAVKTIFFLKCGTVYLVNKILTAEEAKYYLVNEMDKLINNPESYCLSLDEKNELAWHDGFRGDHISESFALMLRWWKKTHELPFMGHINYWK